MLWAKLWKTGTRSEIALFLLFTDENMEECYLRTSNKSKHYCVTFVDYLRRYDEGTEYV